MSGLLDTPWDEARVAALQARCADLEEVCTDCSGMAHEIAALKDDRAAYCQQLLVKEDERSATSDRVKSLLAENAALKKAARALLDKANEYNEQDRMGLLVVQLEALEELL